ncbi:hypothetical protein DFH29DRAFT_521946 [Suillus ampliporus]|nr:hypothetical protein DFH29DRAFT_521946 [Suillus ampliporus]
MIYWVSMYVCTTLTSGFMFHMLTSHPSSCLLVSCAKAHALVPCLYALSAISCVCVCPRAFPLVRTCLRPRLLISTYRHSFFIVYTRHSSAFACTCPRTLNIREGRDGKLARQ